MNNVLKISRATGLYIGKHRWLHMALLALPILFVYAITLMQYPFASVYGDGDTFYAMSEAARKIILEYHQFPWWNPWIAGGIPLYADPQFGLFSVHMVFILIFGSALGWKIALIVYILIGVYGLRKLLVSVMDTPELTASLLAVTWGVSWFWLSRALMGHFTFFTICFLPWMLFLYFNRSATKHAWVKLGLLCALLINTAFHYFTVISFVIFGLFILVDLIKPLLARKEDKTFRQRLWTVLPSVKFLSLAAVIALPLSIHRLYSSIVLSGDYSRVGMRYTEAFSGIRATFNSLFGLHVPSGEVLRSTFSAQEASAGIGLGAFIVLLFALLALFLFRTAKKSNRSSVMQSDLVLIVLAAGFFVIACGDFIVPWSPYALLRHLPFFNQTRVSVRWLILVAFMVILIIANYKDRPKLKWDRQFINMVLAVNAVYLSVIGAQFIATSAPYVFQQESSNSAVLSASNNFAPKQISLWHAPRSHGPKYDENLYNGTVNNVDQISSALLPYYNTVTGGTKICDESKNKSCTFIVTNNADIKKWSPNVIILERKSSGDIELNMSPGKYWTVNGAYVFGEIKSSSQNTTFVIHDLRKNIIIRYAPPGSLAWLSLR